MGKENYARQGRAISRWACSRAERATLLLPILALALGGARRPDSSNRSLAPRHSGMNSSQSPVATAEKSELSSSSSALVHKQSLHGRYRSLRHAVAGGPAPIWICALVVWRGCSSGGRGGAPDALTFFLVVFLRRPGRCPGRTNFSFCLSSSC